MPKFISLKFLSALLIILFCTCLSTSVIAQTEEDSASEEQKVIRVFFPEQEGLSHIDENGNPAGYTYDYLMKIAQRTGWKYEFITGASTNETLQAGLDQLKNGEIDLAGLAYSDGLAKIYEYCSVSYGESSFALVTLDTNSHINERTLFNLSKPTIALVENASFQNEYFETYAKENQLDYHVVYADDNKACQELIEEGKADLMISKDVADVKGYKVVSKFAPHPFYFASSKGNTELTEKLDRAIKEVEATDPYFRAKTYEKHFSKESDKLISFTADEVEYIENAPPIRVIILTNDAPVQAYDSTTDTYSGILIDILKELSVKSGLKFELIAANNQKEAQTLLAENKADMIAGIPYDYATAEEYRVLITSSIFSVPVVRIVNQKQNADESKVVALNNIKMFEGKKNIDYSEDVAQIFQDVDNGKYSEGYLDGYMAQHHLQSHIHNNVFVTPTPYSDYKLCLGVNRSSDLKLVSIMEQTIANLNPSMIEDIVYQNTIYTPTLGFKALIRSNPVEFVTFLGIIFIIIITLILLFFMRTRQVNKMLAKEKNIYKNISNTDRMTETYNNEAFKELVKTYLATTNPMPQGAFIICDIDNFKNINDTYGHLTGDKTLLQLGILLKKLFRSNDVVGRLGGDEFVVLMKDISDINIVKTRCKELLESFRTSSSEYETSLSIGVAMFEGDVSFDKLFKLADGALYIVKNQGKNGFHIVQLSDTTTDNQLPEDSSSNS